jgi:hypothetical protein
MTDEDIELVTTFKYLGITLDTRLDWMCHIDNKIKQAKKYLMMIQQGVCTTWGPTPSVILWLYTGIIRLFVTYGAVVWARKSAMARVASKLLRIQRMGMIRVAPMQHHTHTAGLETILGLPPLDLYIQYLAATTFHRLNLQPQN